MFKICCGWFRKKDSSSEVGRESPPPSPVPRGDELYVTQCQYCDATAIRETPRFICEHCIYKQNMRDKVK